MAGEWLKMECETPEKPEVMVLTATLGWTDTDLTVGKLFKLWCWFDKHTVDGNAVGVTSALLDAKIGVTGFCQAVASVGWLEVYEGGIRLPKFDRHNGTTAKSRSQTAKRVATFKANAKGNVQGNATGNAHTVTDALPREEKRREEKKEQDQEQLPPTSSAPAPLDLGSSDGVTQAKPAKRNGSRLPDDWRPTPELIAAARAERPDIDLRMETAKFRDHWHAKTGRDATKLDWDATYRNWIRNARSPNGFAQRNEPVRHREELRR
jgi:hypothetical protein